MADGKVCTGFSKPFVALYSDGNGTPAYSNGMAAGRGVSVSDDVEKIENKIFYANNGAAENSGRKFNGATISLTIDGLKTSARKLIMGTPTATTKSITVGAETVSVSVDEYDDRQSIPYVGIGFIMRYQEEGVVTYRAVVFTKAMFDIEPLSAETEGEEIEFQTTELSATILRDDSTYHRWKYDADDLTSEAIAEAFIKDVLNITGA